MGHMLVDFLFLFVIVSLVMIVYIRQIRIKEISDELIKVLSKNIDFLTEFQKKQEIVHLKNTIKLYSQFQVILKISKCDYISFFKYDYSKRYVVLHFLLSIDEKGSIIQESMLDKLPATSNLLTLNILNSDGTDLHSISINNIKENDIKVYQIMKYRGVSKLYYQNVFKEEENPLGFISISYKDENYEIPECDKVEILRIIEKIKSFL